MTSPLFRIMLLSLLSVTGITGMLLAESGWDWIFLILAAFPLLLGIALFLRRHIETSER